MPEFRDDILMEIAQLLRGEHPEYKIPEDSFDMSCWYKKDQCGTTGCAMGWAAALLPSVKAFYYLPNGGLFVRPAIAKKLGGHEFNYNLPLGITEEEFEYLFFDETAKLRRSRKKVADRIEKFVIKKRKEIAKKEKKVAA